MVSPIVFFTSTAMRQACEPALESLREISDLAGPERAPTEAVILVTDDRVDPRLFAGQSLIAVVRAGKPTADELAIATEVGVLLVLAAPQAAMIGQIRDILTGSVPEGAINPDQASRLRHLLPPLPPETGGTAGPEPTRYGDWQHKGRVTDF